MNSSASAPEPPLFLVGIPRAGTTWTARVLSNEESLYPVMEPDNDARSAPAIWAKRRVGRFPILRPGDREDDVQRLWAWALAGAPQTTRLKVAARILRLTRPSGRRRFYQGKTSVVMQVAGLVGANPPIRPVPGLSDRRLFVKTVLLPLAVEWLADETNADVLILLRHPGNVLSSWMKLDLNLEYTRLDDHPAIRRQIEQKQIPRPGSDPLERMVWHIGVLDAGLEAAAARHPTWQVRTHEDLCIEPIDKFKRLFDDLGLVWNERVEQYLARNDRPGEGFLTRRVASDQPAAWKQRLTPAQIEVLQRVLSQFSLSTWKEEDLVP
jgi:Sulfotransferase family